MADFHVSRAHVLFKTGDADAPDPIKDRNGEVVLEECRVCGLCEVELDDYPYCPGSREAGQRVRASMEEDARQEG